MAAADLHTRCYRRPRQSVGDDVALAADMAQLRGKFSFKRKLSSLTVQSRL
jgi:hypothetical protein